MRLERVKANTRYIPTLVGRLTFSDDFHAKTAVHPHACGEIRLITRSRFTTAGTSPRLWGDFINGRKGVPQYRYIPTLVGRLTTTSVSYFRVTVHPHACGEINNHICQLFQGDGTSPRLWGDCRQPHQYNIHLRYIPTLVGRLRRCYPGA